MTRQLGNLKSANILLKEMINNKKKLYFEEKITENKNNPKKTLANIKISKYFVINSNVNTNNFCRFSQN